MTLYHHSRRVCLLIPAIAVLIGQAAASKDASPETTPSFLSHEIVVTAARLETPLIEIASAVTVITREDLERTHPASVLDALRDTPGLGLVRNGGPGAASSILVRGANSEHVLVLLDGVPLNDPINPSRSFDLAHMTLDGVERIEILRGPQSTLYGSDALGGVINILTGRGMGKPAVTFRARGGSHGTLSGGLDIRGSAGAFRYDLSASRESTEGVSAASSAYAGNTEQDGYRNWTLSGRAGLVLAGGTEIDLIIRGVSARTDLDAFGGAYGDDPNSIQDYRSGFVRAQIRTLSAGGRWESKAGFAYIRSTRENDNPVDESHPFDSETARYRSARFRADWQNNLFLRPGHTLTAGAEIERETGDSAYFSESLWGPYASVFSRRHADRAGVFVQDRFRLGRAFFATAGLRLDLHGRSGTSLTFRLAPAYLIEKTGTKLKATIGTAFKAPSLYQLYAPETLWGPVGNEHLLPEESLGWDAGVEQTLAGGAILLGASFFQSDFRNLIDYDFLQGYINIGRARTSGWEFTADARPVERLTLRLGYTRLAAEDLDAGVSLLRRPKDKLSGAIEWTPATGWKAVLTAAATGERRDYDYTGWAAVPVILPSYAIVDALLSYTPAPGLEFFGRWDNIGNTRYETVFGYGTWGSSISAGCTVRF